MSSSSTTSSRRPLSRDYDTGFPEAMEARTTSWRHPEANTAPGACISGQDVDPAKALNRHRRSFLHKKHKRTTSHGFITEDAEPDSLAGSTTAFEPPDSAIDMGLADDKAVVEAGEEGGVERPSKDDTESINRADGSLKGHALDVSMESGYTQSGAPSPRRRSGLFKRYRSQRA